MLSLRVRDCLTQAKISTLSELQNKKPEELLPQGIPVGDPEGALPIEPPEEKKVP